MVNNFSFPSFEKVPREQRAKTREYTKTVRNSGAITDDQFVVWDRQINNEINDYGDLNELILWNKTTTTEIRIWLNGDRDEYYDVPVGGQIIIEAKDNKNYRSVLLGKVTASATVNANEIVVRYSRIVGR